MNINVRQLADLVGGIVRGDGNHSVHAARVLQEAQPGDITFLENAKEFDRLKASQASAAVVPPGFSLSDKVLIEAADPLMAFVTIVQQFQGKPAFKPGGIDQRAVVHPSSRIGADPTIHPNAVVGANSTVGQRCQLHTGVVIGKNCRLGDDVVLLPNVVLYDDTVLGDRVTIHANSTIGADGFGYRFAKGKHVKVPQLGNVVVGNDVEIGANTTIDRATFGSTTIGDGTKIDNLVQIAHNCRIGKHNALAAQVGIAGSCTIGDYVLMGGQVGISDHITVGDGARFGAKTGNFRDVEAGERMFMYPAFKEQEAGRILACMKRLPEMRRELLRVLKLLGVNETKKAA